MTGGASPGREVVLETDRLLLGRGGWARRSSSASCGPNATRGCRRAAGSTRTGAPPSPSSRRRSAPTRPPPIGLLAVERKAAGDVIGYCGLVDSGRAAAGEPELAFELLRRVWGQGYATEAALAVLDWARSLGYERLWATVWDWNTASRRVLAKVGFTATGRCELDDPRDDAVHHTAALTPGPGPSVSPGHPGR